MGKSRQQAQEDGKVSPEEATQTGNQTTAVEQEAAGGAGELDTQSGVSETKELSPLSKEDQHAAIAGSMGGTDNYPYVDRTAVPLHERSTIAMGTSPLDEASQAELNPAFTPKPEDGGPVRKDADGNDVAIGTEPNVVEQTEAKLEGDDEALAAFQDQVKEGESQQMDAQAVTDAAQERTPDNVDATTGQKEGSA